MHLRTTLCAIAILATLAPGGAETAVPAAIVINIEGPQNAPVYIMQYLRAREQFTLNHFTILTVAYLKSCVTEKITGGHVVIGTERSTVRERGSQSWETSKCDSANISPVTRAEGAELTIYGLSPVFRVQGPRIAHVVRVDAPAPELALKVPEGVSEYDMAKHGQKLEPGGVYRVTVSYRRVVVRVDPAAKATVPVISRLIDL